MMKSKTLLLGLVALLLVSPLMFGSGLWVR